MISQFSNIVINAVYGSSYELTDCYVNSKSLSDEIKHPIFLYHRGDVDSLKSDILAFQTRFLTADPYSNSVEKN